MRQHHLLRLTGMSILIAIAFLGCTRESKELSAGYKGYNILLISIDTLRADHLGCYGYRKKTPYIDLIAAKSFVFESMFTTSSTTTPAHVSLLTALYPRDCRNGYYLRDSVTTMAEIFSENGYFCLAFVSALPLDVRFNLDQGFSYYDSDFSGCRGSIHLQDNRWFAHDYKVFDRNAGETTQKVISTLRKRKLSTPYFLWIHYYDPHLPYQPPVGYYDTDRVTRSTFPYYFQPSKSDLESLNELYDGEIQFVDHQLKKLIDGLKELGAYDNTILVIVSDHGENLYEHDNFLDHSQVVYDTVMWIPCLIFLPGCQGKRIDDIVSIMDIMPTLLDLGGITNKGFEGRSLIVLMEGDSPVPVRTYVTCETNDFDVKQEEQTIAVRTKRMKYIYNNWKRGGNLFFNLQEDPREKQPMLNLVGTRAKELTYFYQEWRGRYKTGQMSAKFELDKETKEALKSLGYLK
jgi:arylsulfatase A-like enzyme